MQKVVQVVTAEEVADAGDVMTAVVLTAEVAEMAIAHLIHITYLQDEE